MWLKRQVVMLPTNEKASAKGIPFHLGGDGRLRMNYSDVYSPFEFQKHLYIITDETKREGDWFVHNNIIGKCLEGEKWQDCKKIIATTSRLDTTDEQFHNTFKQYLPQPSQSFIEKYVEEYNKGNIITEVMVEYEQLQEMDSKADWFEQLKINPKDNTITIRKCKDNWSREEVIDILYKHTESMFSRERITLDKWIEQNL